MRPPAEIDGTAPTPATPEAALGRMQEGNERFVAGRPLDRDLVAAVRRTAAAQTPFAAVLGCIDSRVPPELVFDQGIGDLICARVAGNVVNPDILGSLEFAAKVLGVRLIVVLGHTACGAITGACDGVELGHLTRLLADLRSVADAVVEAGDRTSGNRAFVDRVAAANVARTVEAIVGRSEVIRDLVTADDLAVVGAMHDVATGRVTFLD
jgi:carbonic anhydrase